MSFHHYWYWTSQPVEGSDLLSFHAYNNQLYCAQTPPASNRIITFQGKYYCHHDDTLYHRLDDGDWVKISFSELPGPITITESGSLWIKETLPSEKLAQGEYIGDPVEDIPSNTCLCPMQTLMSDGCKCGGG